LSDFHYHEYHKRLRVADLLTSEGTVVVAGGDGAVGSVARQILHSRHTLGILPAGTYNNFANALGIPPDIEAALAVVKRGRAKPVSVGMANGEPFLEAALVGAFGEALQAGEAIKELEVGELFERFRALAESPKFAYRLTGDVSGRGEARNLSFANAPRIGTHIRVSDGTPRDTWLEISLGEATLEFRRLRLQTTPRVRVFADARPIGRTPVSIEANPGALRVLLLR